MEHTEQQKAAFKKEFSLRRKRQIIVAIPLIAAIVCFAMFADQTRGGLVLGLPMAVALPAFAVVILGALAFSFRNWRCPACNRYLGKAANPRFCPKCGVGLR